MDLKEILGLIASFATAIAVLLIFWQILLSKQQAITAFEDDLTKQYRDIIKNIPLEALLGENLDNATYTKTLNHFYHYIDLCCQQVFLRQNNRINKNTWENWRNGIKSNLSRPAFKKAWEEIKERSNGNFSELRELEKCDYNCDPKKWGAPRDIV